MVRLEFPAQGYVNVRNTTLEFDVTLYAPATPQGQTRFQNDIQSIFSRLRILYGGTPLEDIIDYHYVRRMMTEWTGTNQNGLMDQSSIANGIGGQMIQTDGGGTVSGHVNVRQKMIHGYSGAPPVATSTPVVVATPADFTAGLQFDGVGDNTQNPAGVIGLTPVTRRYCVQLGAGLLNQDKLIPTKWMASQFAIELTLANAADCIYSPSAVPFGGNTITPVTPPTYAVSNVNLIPEILQFDPSYDEAFLQGLKSGGVPIKFASWHRYGFVTSGTNVSLNIQEKSRSVKSIYTVQKRASSNFASDSGACFFDTFQTGASTLQTYQYRVGGRYFPGAPVECSPSGSARSNGAAEAFSELEKALGTMGDARLSRPVCALTWGLQSGVPGTDLTELNFASGFHEYDYKYDLAKFGTNGVPTLVEQECKMDVLGSASYSTFCGTIPSQAFAMAINLETTNGSEVSGLNAEEQVLVF